MREEELYERVLERMDMSRELEDEEVAELIHEVLREAAKEEYLPLEKQIYLSRRLFHSLRKLDVLQELIEDESVTEIMINGPDRIFVEKEGRLYGDPRRRPGGHRPGGGFRGGAERPAAPV